ncbi:MAG TPA: MBL fold metallo-hydrolase [Bryobacteraceae bacterium]|nr:MBL fold metallo-hydrolase [Bryobacteraceae bacterium]
MSTHRAFVIRLGGIAVCLAGLWLVWSQAQQQPAPLTMEKISANLYVIVGDGGNVAFMPTDEGVLVVDDKFARDAPQIMEKIKSVTDKPVKYVLNTHQHGDHTGGNEAMISQQRAQVLIHRNARDNMAAGKMPGLPQITYADAAQVFVGGKEVDARHFGRGHTNGDAVIYFPAERVLHTGDLFVNGQAPFIDYSAHGSIVEWDQTVDKALQLDFDTVIPGHGPVAKKADLMKWKQTLATLRSRTKTACAGGAADAAKRIDAKDLGMGANPNFDRSIAGMCQELAR